VKSEILVKKYESFRPDVQKEIVDFIEYLEIKYKPFQKTKNITKPNLDKEPFVGMWKDRSEMKNPEKYVKSLRDSQWYRG
jgi:hypothetical protein